MIAFVLFAFCLLCLALPAAMVQTFALHAIDPISLKYFGQMISYQFMHENLQHVLGNWRLGLPALWYIADRYGNRAALALFLSCGMAGAALHTVALPDSYCIGSSAATVGVTVAALSELAKDDGVTGAVRVISRMMQIQMICLMAFNVADMVTLMSPIANHGHLGGLLCGLTWASGGDKQ